MRIGKYSFGSTAAIITSMGLIAGLNYGNGSKMGIISALLIFAIADNVSDSFGIHVYKESEDSTSGEIFSTTFGNFLIRLLIALSFILLVLFLPANLILWLASFWGLLLLGILSYSIAKTKKTQVLREIAIHLLIAILVIVASKYLGLLIANNLK